MSLTNSPLQITLFGGFELHFEGHPAALFKGDRPVSLLAYLLLHRKSAVSRAHLAYTFWPDSSDSQARTNLRNLFHALRQALPDAETYLAADSLTMRWRPDAPYSLDVADFEDALHTAATAENNSEKRRWLETAVSIYKGDLLPGNYEDWIIPARESLQQSYAEALQQLVELLEEAEDYRAASRAAQRLILLEPLDEAAYVQLMRLYALNGDRARVRRTYEQCRSTLISELNVQPATATDEAYARYLAMNASPSTPSLSLAGVPPKPRLATRNLPQTATPFIGRERELAEISSLLSGALARLVTIVGPGGAGKTRLAIRTAADLAATFTDGAVFVSLAPVIYPEGVAPALASALELPLSGAAAEDEVIHYLLDRDILIVLDNLEHLLNASAFIARIMQQAPGVRLLATSRERLRLQSEWVYKLGGLDVPPETAVADAAKFEAVRLFLEMSSRTGGELDLTEENQLIITQICRLLDGMPLALELAAAQTSFLTPQALLHRLDDALPLLVDGARDLPPRQRTIRATIEWSTDLLSETEQALFTQLAVFRGGFSLEAAESICISAPLTAAEVLPLVRRLLDSSLVVQDVTYGRTRYRFLEPVRQFAVEQLLAGGRSASLYERHADYYLNLAQQAAPRLQSPQQVEWLDQLAREFSNIRAAMRWYLRQGRLEQAARLGWDLWVFLWLRGFLSLGRRWVTGMLPQTEQHAEAVRGLTLLFAMVIGFGQGDYEWAASFVDEALSLYDSLDDALHLAHATALAGLIRAGQRRYDVAEPLMALGVERYLALDATWNAAMLLTYWAAIPRNQGDLGRARQITGRALELARQQGDAVTMYSTRFNLASIAQAQGNFSEALSHFRAALSLAVEVGDSGNFSPSFKGIAEAAAAQGGLDYAVLLWAAADALLEDSEAAVYTYAPDQAQAAEALNKVRELLSHEEWTLLWQEGRSLSLDQALQLALKAESSP